MYGLTDLFGIADCLTRKRLGRDQPLLRVSHFSRTDTDGSIARVFDSSPGAEGMTAVIILPPSLGDPLGENSMVGLVDWLRARHATGTVLASVCAGAFLLAETGLLAGRAATTHWICAAALAEQFPDISVDADKLIIDDGDIITAGGLMAWTDLGLKLVERLLGPTAMIDTSRLFLRGFHMAMQQY